MNNRLDPLTLALFTLTALSIPAVWLLLTVIKAI